MDYNIAALFTGNASSFMRAAAEVNRAFDALQAKSNLAGKRMGKDFDSAGAKMARFGDDLSRNITAGSLAASKAVSKLGKAFTMGLSVPGVAALTAMSKASIAFERDLIGVGKTTDMAGEELKQFGEQVLMTARTLPAAHSEILNVAEAAGQLGIQKENILSFTDVMIKMGIATNLTATDAAEAFARFASIVGMSSSDFDRLGATVVHLGNNLATSEKEIVDMGLRLSGVSTQINMTENQVMGLAGAMSSVGFTAEAGGSAMTRSLQKINTAVLGSTDKLEGFARVAGVSAEEFATAWRTNPMEAFQLFIRGLDDVTKSGGDATQVLQDLEITSIREKDVLLRLAGANELLTQSLDLANVAWEENIALNDEAAMRFASTDGKIQLAKNAMNEFAKRTGDAAKEGMVPLIETFTPMINGFNDMTPAAHQAIVGLIGFTTALGPMLMGVGALGEAFSTIPGVFQKFQDKTAEMAGAVSQGFTTIVGKAGDMKQGVSTAYSNMGNVVTKVGDKILDAQLRLIADFPQLATALETQSQKISSVMTKLGETISVVTGPIGSKLEDLSIAMERAFTGMTTHVSNGVSRLQPLFAIIPQMADKSMTGLVIATKLGLSALAPGVLVGALIVGLGALYTAFEGQIDAIAQVGIHKGPYIISNLTRGMVKKIPEFAAKGTEAMTLFAQAIVANLPVIFEGGVQIIEEIARGVMNNAPQLVANAVMVIGTFAQGLASAIPRLVVAGFEIILGLVKGIVQNLPLIIEQGLKAVTNLITGIGQNMGSILSIGGEIVLTLAQGILSLITHLPQIALELIKAFIAGIKAAFGSIKDVGGQLVGKIKEGIFGRKKEVNDEGQSTTESFAEGVNAKNVEWAGQEKMNEVVKGAKDESHKMGEVGTDSINIFKERVKREEPAAEQAGKGVMDSTAKGAESEKDKMGQAANKGSSSFLENILQGNPDANAAGADMAGASTEGMDSRQGDAADSGTRIKDSFIQPIDEAIPEVKEKSQTLVDTLTNTLTEQAPAVEESGVAIMTAITNGIGSQLDTLNEAGSQIITALITSITNETEQLNTVGTSIISSIIQGIYEEAETLNMTGETIVQTILQSIIEQLPMLEMIGNEMIMMIIEAIQIGLPLMLEAGMSIAESINEGIMAGKEMIGETMTSLATDIMMSLEEISIIARDQSTNIGLAMQEGIESSIPQITNSFIAIENAVTNTLNTMSKSVTKSTETMMSKMTNIIDTKTSAASSKFDKMGANLTNGMSKTSSSVQKTTSQMMSNVNKSVNEGVIKTQTSFTNMGNKVGAQIENMSRRTSSSINSMINNMSSTVNKGANDMGRAFANMSSSTVNEIARMASSVVSSTTSMMSSFNSSISNGMNTAKNNVRSNTSSMVSTVRGFRGQFTSAGRNLMAGLQAGIYAGRSGVINAARSVMRAAVAAAKAAADIHSPSRVMRDEVGVMLSLGLAEGIVRTNGKPEQAMTDVVNSTIAAGEKAAQKKQKLDLVEVTDGKINARFQVKKANMNKYLTDMYREALSDREKFVKAMSRITDYADGRYDDLMHADHTDSVGYMAEIIDEINNMTDETEKAALISELFGDTWSDELSQLVSEVGSFQNSFQPSSWMADEAKLFKMASREITEEVRALNEQIKEENRKIEEELREKPIKPTVDTSEIEGKVAGNWAEALSGTAEEIDRNTREKLLPAIKKSMDDVIYMYRTYNESFRNTGKDYILNLTSQMAVQFKELRKEIIPQMDSIIHLYRTYNQSFRNTGKDYMLNMGEAMKLQQAQLLSDSQSFVQELTKIYDEGLSMIQHGLQNLNTSARRTVEQSVNLTQKTVQPLNINMKFGDRSYGAFVNDIKNTADKQVHLEEIYGL